MSRACFAVALTALIIMGFVGCAKESSPPASELPRPVKTAVVESPSSGGLRKFPARIAAAQEAELSFRVSGVVQELPVNQGDDLAEGDLIARLAARDYQIVVNDRRATYDNARKNYRRGQELVTTGAISKLDFDRLESEFQSASAALDAANQELEYTQLRAPFAGTIARKFVDQFEEVQAKQAIAVLQNLDTLEVIFDVPEGIVRRIQARSEGDAAERIQATVGFEDRPDEVYSLTFQEVSTRADDATQTFEVIYRMEQLPKGVILPGMTATVTVDLTGHTLTDPIFAIPSSAVFAASDLTPRVWVVDPETLTVSPRIVSLGRMVGSNVEVLDGLETGMRIVTAGTPFLVEGMKVRLLEEREQAEPRLDDLAYQ